MYEIVKKHRSGFKGKAELVVGIRGEQGYQILGGAISNYFGAYGEGHPCLNRFSKKIGVYTHRVNCNEMVACIVYMEDFSSTMV